MSFLKFNTEKCTLCGVCIEQCPFGVLHMDGGRVECGDGCRMCRVCVRACPEGAVEFEQTIDSLDKNEWKDFLIFVEQENARIHPVALELFGEARRLAAKVGYKVNCLMIGGKGTAGNAEKLLAYGVDKVFVYEHEEFTGFRADSYTDAAADCIAQTKPGSVLIGGTELGRSLAPRLSTRFKTGLTADCTRLDIRENTDMVQIRPAFGGNIMAQIVIEHSRPQFATVRYRVLDSAEPVAEPRGEVVLCDVSDRMVLSGIEVLSREVFDKVKGIEDEDILVVAGRGAQKPESLELCRKLAGVLGGQLAFTRPMVEGGFGEQTHQIGLSGRTVRPKLIITCGVSGAIQFTTCMRDSECIVAINKDPEARIFSIAHYCVTDDLNEVIPQLISRIESEVK